MKCQRCQRDASIDFAFCPGCGNKLTVSPATVSVAAADADRRLATVLFADLTGFTTISEKLDPEDVRALQTDLFGTLSELVERFDAFVEKFVGDAVNGGIWRAGGARRRPAACLARRARDA